MKSLRSKDRNFIFRFNRENLIKPQEKSNLYVPYFEGVRQNWEKLEPPNGQDQNLFFRVKKTPQPILPKRIISGALNPLSSDIGQLPQTRRERQNNTIVKSIEMLLKTFRDFITSGQVDEGGNPIIDPLTGVQKVKIRSITDILNISHKLLENSLEAAGVIIDAGIERIIRSLSVHSAVAVVESTITASSSDISVTPSERKQIFDDIIIKERLTNDNEIPFTEEGDNSDLIQTLYRSVAAQNLPVTWDDPRYRDIFRSRYLTARDWGAYDNTTKQDVKQFIMTRESSLDVRLTGVRGHSIPITNRGEIIGDQLDIAENVLDLFTLRFITKEIIPTTVAEETIVDAGFEDIFDDERGDDKHDDERSTRTTSIGRSEQESASSSSSSASDVSRPRSQPSQASRSTRRSQRSIRTQSDIRESLEGVTQGQADIINRQIAAARAAARARPPPELRPRGSPPPVGRRTDIPPSPPGSSQSGSGGRLSFSSRG